MRVIAVCAAKTDLKFRSDADRRMYLTALNKLEHQPVTTAFDGLRRGCIICLALIADAFEFQTPSPSDGPVSSWAFGPTCYHIVDVYYIQNFIPHSGNLGLSTLTESAHAELISDHLLMVKMEQWRQRALGSATGWIEDNLTRALSIRQPAAEAIAVGTKDIENRSRQIFAVRAESNPVSLPSSLDNWPLRPKSPAEDNYKVRAYGTSTTGSPRSRSRRGRKRQRLCTPASGPQTTRIRSTTTPPPVSPVASAHEQNTILAALASVAAIFKRKA